MFATNKEWRKIQHQNETWEIRGRWPRVKECGSPSQERKKMK